MSYPEQLAAEWRLEIDRMKAAIPLWESGQMHVFHNQVEVTQEHIENLHRMIAALEEALPILERPQGA